MTGLLRQLDILLTSRYHASVLSMEHAVPIVAVSIDARLSGVMHEVGLAGHYLHPATDNDLEQRIMASLKMADEHQQEIKQKIKRQLAIYKDKTMAMTQFFTSWLTKQFS